MNAVPHLVDAQSLPSDTRGLDDRLTAESVRQNALTATLVDEFLPDGAVPGTWRSQPLGSGGVVAIEGVAQIDVLRESGTMLLLRVHADGAVVVRLGRWVFPGWALLVDGVSQELEPNRFGSVDVAISTGTHDVELRFRAPAVRRAGLVVSVVALVLWTGLFVRSKHSSPSVGGGRRRGSLA